MDDIFTALLTDVVARLKAVSGNFGDNVYYVTIPEDVTKPYCIVDIISNLHTGMNLNNRHEVLLQVVCVADTITVAFAGARDIQDALENQGEQDSGGSFTGGDDWTITTTILDQGINQVITNNNATVYQAGHTFRIIMEEV